MGELHEVGIYSKRISETLQTRDTFTAHRLFGLYTALRDDASREAFVLALIGQLLLETKRKEVA